MNTNQTRDELFERHLQGELSDVEKEHVAELLDSDAAARQQFVELAQWDTELGETIREHAEPVDNEDLLPSGKGTRERGGTNTFLLFKNNQSQNEQMSFREYYSYSKSNFKNKSFFSIILLNCNH